MSVLVFKTVGNGFKKNMEVICGVLFVLSGVSDAVWFFLFVQNTTKKYITTCTLWPVTSIILKTSGCGITSMNGALMLLS